MLFTSQKGNGYASRGNPLFRAFGEVPRVIQPFMTEILFVKVVYVSLISATSVLYNSIPMDKRHTLLLAVWKEACRHIELRESAASIAAIIAERLPDSLLMILRFEPTSFVELAAEASCGLVQSSEHTRHQLSEQVFQDLLRWCNEGSRIRARVSEVQRRWPGLILEKFRGQLLMTPLRDQGMPAGLLVLVGDKQVLFDDEHELLLEALREPFEAALANDRQLRELERLRAAAEADKSSALRRLGRKELGDVVVGAESGLRTVMERAAMVARSDVPVLLLGETGTGKEVIAREIHQLSGRSSGPFLRVNCGAIPAELIDSELFGHEVGSFTGAVSRRKGWFERADGGTLMLDEIAEMSPAAQVRLLRVLQDGTFDRVGGQSPLHVNVRVVAATHRDLQGMIRDGKFREDLWYRIAVFPIYLPALRERSVDIPALANHFALRAAHRLDLAPQLPTPDDLALLSAYDWPGNIREFSAVMERAAILGDGRGLEIARALGVHPAKQERPGIASANRDGAGGIASPAFALRPAAENESLDVVMRRHIEDALRRAGGRVEGRFGAARELNINPNTLRGRMRKLKINWKSFRDPPRSRRRKLDGTGD